jgi:F-type H+-transporting ATPase subunit b
MKTSLTKLIGGIALMLALGTTLPALAQEPGVAKEGTSALHYETPEDRAHEAGADEGIVNWWSFDYGEKTKDASHKGWPPPFGWALVNFAVFLGVLSKILWKPLKDGWEKRHDTIKHELAEATRLRKAAEAQLAEYTKKVSHVDDEVNALLQQLRHDAELDRARIIEAAEHEAQRLKVEADRQIQVEIERARAELRKETVDAALKAAEQILRSHITADDQQRLAKAYVDGVEATRARGAS